MSISVIVHVLAFCFVCIFMAGCVKPRVIRMLKKKEAAYRYLILISAHYQYWLYIALMMGLPLRTRLALCSWSTDCGGTAFAHDLLTPFWGGGGRSPNFCLYLHLVVITTFWLSSSPLLADTWSFHFLSLPQLFGGGIIRFMIFLLPLVLVVM